MTARAVLRACLLLVGTAAAGTLHAQALKRYTTSRQFHGEVRLDARIEFGGGTLEVRAGRPGSLYTLQLAYDDERFQPVSRWNAEQGAVTLGLTSRGQGKVGVNAGTQRQDARIEFSPQADLSLSLSLGAAVSVVDLGGLRLASLSLETGASQTEVRFSKRNAMRCTSANFTAGVAALAVTGLANSRCDSVAFTGGMGSVVLDYTGEWLGDARLDASLAVGGLTLRIPREVGVTITTERFMATFEPEGFARQGNRYASANLATAAHHLDVTLTTSLGGVSVEWVD